MKKAINRADAKYEDMTVIMKAMAHPTRLFILDKLKEREHCVCELTDLVGDDISTVSRHLSVLRNAGIISSRKQNNMVFYKLLCPCVLDFYQCMLKIK
jgi:DNA-binding transcriptional ArsR family regulator